MGVLVFFFPPGSYFTLAHERLGTSIVRTCSLVFLVNFLKVVFFKVISKHLNFLSSQTARIVRFISPVAILDLSWSFTIQHSLQYTGMGTSKVLYIPN
jgi:hypothetical protein